jgi:hypothetical protein
MFAICAGAKKLNSAVCHQSDNDKRAHCPAGPQGAMPAHSFRHLMQVHGFRHLLFSNGVSISRLLCLLGVINTQEINSLFSLG